MAGVTGKTAGNTITNNPTGGGRGLEIWGAGPQMRGSSFLGQREPTTRLILGATGSRSRGLGAHLAIRGPAAPGLVLVSSDPCYWLSSAATLLPLAWTSGHREWSVYIPYHR